MTAVQSGGQVRWTFVQPSARRRGSTDAPTVGSVGRSFGIVGEDGEPLLTARVRSGLTRSSGEVEITAGAVAATSGG